MGAWAGGGRRIDGWLALALAALYVVYFRPVKASRGTDLQSGKGDCSLTRCGCCTRVPGTATNADVVTPARTVGDRQRRRISHILRALALALLGGPSSSWPRWQCFGEHVINNAYLGTAANESSGPNASGIVDPMHPSFQLRLSRSRLVDRKKLAG